MTKKKNIALDFEKIADPFSGLGQYCLHLKKSFLKNPQEFDFQFFVPQNKWEKKLHRLYPFFQTGFDLYHAIHQDSPFRPLASIPAVLTVHDLNFLDELKDPRPALQSLKKKIDRANHVVAISEFTKKELLKYFPHLTVAVNYNGLVSTNDYSRPSFFPNRPYYFSIGAIVEKKNFDVFIDFLKAIPDLTLVLAGNDHYRHARSLKAKIAEHQLSDRFLLVGPVTDGEKNYLYRHAKGFIYPSLLEGFGLPVLEAMHHRVPLYLSPRTAIPEVAGPDAFYFSDVLDGRQMAEEFLKANPFTAEQLDRLKQRSTLFNFDQTAKNYLDIYRGLLQL